MAKAHFLPQIFLKGFSPNGDDVYQTNIIYGNTELKKLEAVAYKPDLYSFVDSKGVKHEDVENPILSSLVEKDYDKVINKLEHKYKLDSNELEILFVFLSFFFNRVPRRMESLKALSLESSFAFLRGQAKYAPEELRAVYDQIQKDPNLKDKYSWEDYIAMIKEMKADDFNWDDNKPKYEFIMFMLSTAKELYFIMRSLKLKFIFSEGEFLTGDFPYFIVNPIGEGRGLLNGDFYFPLSSNVCLLLTSNPNVKRLKVEEINQEIVNASERYVYSKKNIDIKKYLEHRKETMRTKLEFFEDENGLLTKLTQD